MCGCLLGDRLVEHLDGFQRSTQLHDQGAHEQRVGCYYPLVGGQWCGLLNGEDAPLDDVAVVHMMFAEEALEGCAAGELDGLERGPAAEKVTEQARVLVLKPLKRLREVLFERVGEAIGNTGLVVDVSAS